MSDRKTVQADKKKQAALEAAARLFLSKGYGSVSMDEIAAEANISKRTLYNRFPSKEALFGEVVTDIWESLDIPVLPSAKGSDIKNALTDFARKLLALLRSERFSGLLRLVAGESGRFPELSKLYGENSIQPLIDGLGGYFAECASLGILKTDDHQFAARQFLGMVKENLFWPILLGIYPMPSEAEDAEVIKKSIDIILRIYAAE